MDQQSAEFLSRKLGIAVEQVVREEFEIAVLKTFLEAGPGVRAGRGRVQPAPPQA